MRVNVPAAYLREYDPKAGPAALVAAIIERARSDVRAGQDRFNAPDSLEHKPAECAEAFLGRLAWFVQTRSADPVAVSLYVLAGVVE